MHRDPFAGNDVLDVAITYYIRLSAFGAGGKAVLVSDSSM
jgi:hypothetical protein